MGNHLRRDTDILKAFSGCFGFDGLRISQIQTVSQDQSNGNAPRGVIIVPISMVGYGIYIGVGLSALLGSTNRAVREPLDRGPGTELAPRFLYVCSKLETITSALGARWQSKNRRIWQK